MLINILIIIYIDFLKAVCSNILFYSRFCSHMPRVEKYKTLDSLQMAFPVTLKFKV